MKKTSSRSSGLPSRTRIRLSPSSCTARAGFEPDEVRRFFKNSDSKELGSTKEASAIGPQGVEILNEYKFVVQ